MLLTRKEALYSTARKYACGRDSASSGSRLLARSAPTSRKLSSRPTSTKPNSSASALRQTSKGSGFPLWLRVMAHVAAPAAENLMEHPGFFERAGPFPLGAVAESANANTADGADLGLAIKDVRPLDSATRGDLSFLDNPKYLPLFATTAASACLVAPKFAGHAPAGTACLVTPEPYRAFAQALFLFYPDALKPKGGLASALDAPSLVHPSATL